MKPRNAAMPLPAGFHVVLDPDTKQLDNSTLFGGSPARVVRLSTAGRKALAELQSGPVASAASGALARRLSDAGLLHPRPPATTAPLDATVVIPVWGRTTLLALGVRGAGVAWRSGVACVPPPAFFVGRTALPEAARGRDIFDPAPKGGEDVAPVWRLHKPGGPTRSDPASTMQHHEPKTWSAL